MKFHLMFDIACAVMTDIDINRGVCWSRLTDTGQTVDDVIATGSRKRKAGSKAIWSGKRSKLAVHCGADVLDMTAIHPESYAVTER